MRRYWSYLLFSLFFIYGCSSIPTTMKENPNNAIQVDEVPNYTDQPYVEVNENIPTFETYEIQEATESYEYYSELDELGRAQYAQASVSLETMPTQKRESISEVKPSGWNNEAYSCVDGKWIYNRSHLIGYQLTGENANAKNLVTGTRYMNVEGMLPFENEVDDYIEQTGNHVLYRVTPIYEGDNLVASGIQMEAYSVEDNGKGIQFNIYVYNVQPGVEINYTDGSTNSTPACPLANESVSETEVAYISGSGKGKAYHTDPHCSGMKNAIEISVKDAKEQGYKECEHCN